MQEIGIDIETRSGISLLKSNVYRYVESEHFAILLFAYTLDNGATVHLVYDLTQEQLPQNMF
jgi:DNA polymerase